MKTMLVRSWVVALLVALLGTSQAAPPPFFEGMVEAIGKYHVVAGGQKFILDDNTEIINQEGEPDAWTAVRRGQMVLLILGDSGIAGRRGNVLRIEVREPH